MDSGLMFGSPPLSEANEHAGIVIDNNLPKFLIIKCIYFNVQWAFLFS